tara:strand:- start:912 stop:1151 length:240 start_codon:yes stop_codon:yes gene_type:complete
MTIPYQDQWEIIKNDPPTHLKPGDLVQRKHRPVVDSDGVGWVALVLGVEMRGGYTYCEFRWLDNLECGKCSAALFKVLS